MNMSKDEATGKINFEFHRARVLSESKDELVQALPRVYRNVSGLSEEETGHSFEARGCLGERSDQRAASLRRGSHRIPHAPTRLPRFDSLSPVFQILITN